MSDTIVIDGEVELLNVIDGDPDVCIGAGGGSQPTGTKSILLTEAGTKTEDVTAYASAEINAVTDATASGAVASFSDGAEDVPMTSCVANIEPVQSGSGDPSPSNVRPISGWSEVKVTRTGINVWDEEWESGDISSANGNNTTNANFWRSINYIPVAPSTLYYAYSPTASGKSIRPRYYDANKVYLGYGSATTGTTFTTIAGARYMRFAPNASDVPNHDISINYPSTDTAYHAYTGTEYPVSLGQTVYGGTLDVVSGVMTVDRVMHQLTGSESFTLSGATSANPRRFMKMLSAMNWEPAADNQGGISDRLVYKRTAAVTDAFGTFRIGSYLTIPDSESVFASANDFNAYLLAQYNNNTPVEICYPLATPTTVQLTPTEVTTLLGSNNVWADSGSISVGYKADIFLYADSLETIIDTLTGGA